MCTLSEQFYKIYHKEYVMKNTKNTQTHAHTHIHIYIYIYIYIHMQMYIFLPKFIHADISAYLCMHMYAYLQACSADPFTNIYIYICMFL